MSEWTVESSLDLYNVPTWGGGFFTVSDRGHLMVTPAGPDGPRVDLPDLVQDLRKRGLDLPLLIRFSDILASRLRNLHACFREAAEEYGFEGGYQPVYPIKVNQQRHVVEELIHYGREFHLGLEAGSKPELLVALALLEDAEAPIILNGYKDEAYIETACLAQKLGRTPVLVVDRLQELDTILRVSERLGVKPHLGVRARLTAPGAGKWMASTGDRSKFGLTPAELVAVVDRLRDRGMLDCLELLHYHIGSQISAIRAVKEALREASRVFVELRGMGAALTYFDVGGGLAVDYDGSSTDFASSANYSLQEYANDVVAAVAEACNDRETPHPILLSESGRALVAHHSLLVFNVLGVDRMIQDEAPPLAEEDEAPILEDFRTVLEALTEENVQESYHDALHCREEAVTLFNLGYLDLAGRARAEQLFRACLARVLETLAGLETVPEELEGLEEKLSDTYFCNFSVFQSVPDHWAVGQLFPTLPIHRLDEAPTRRGVLADLTCDSDGKVDRFIGLRDEKHTLELHPLREGEAYYLGMFLVGAYQEILGDLHNLFGDTTAVHVALDDGGYSIEHVVEADTVTEVLEYVQYEPARLIRKLRGTAEKAHRAGRISLEESAKLLRAYREGLNGSTYLE